MPIRIKRIHEDASAADGVRILVDRLWPRGIARQAARIDDWANSLAPSSALRRRFDHDAGQWDDFVAAYRLELAAPDAQASLDKLRAVARKSTLTLLYAARNETHNNAVALKLILEAP